MSVYQIAAQMLKLSLWRDLIRMADGQMSAVRRRTKKLIQDSFIGLLEDKPLQKITVRDLCSAADINRATFYRYYVDLNELNDELADNLFQKLFCNLADRSVARGSADKEAARTLFVEALRIMEKNQQLCRNLLRGTKGAFAKRLRSSLELLVYKDSRCPFPEKAGLMLDYMIAGIIESTHSWLEGGCAVDKVSFADMLYEASMPCFHLLDQLQ